MNRQDKEVMPSTTKMLWKSFLSICIVLLMPIIFCTLLAMCGLIFNYFTSLLNIDLLGGKNGDGSSIAFCILKANISPDKIKEINEVTWDNIKVSMSFNDFKTYIGSENLNWVMLLLSECCILVGLGMCTLTVSERLINIVLLYLISPIIIATIPLDDGKRWENWKDITTSKITTAGANIISLYAFLYIITVFGDKILNGVSGDRGIMNVVYLFIAVGGSFVSAKGGTLMASIISANQGQQEGMSFMASQGMAKMGLRLAGGVSGAAFTATGTKKLALMIHDK